MCLIKRAASGGSYWPHSLPHRSVAHFTLRKQDVSPQTLPVAVYWGRLCMNYMSERHLRGAQREQEVENKGGLAFVHTGANIGYIKA